uniref:Uncharacterized protein n=1 Tax=Rhizophora mucronata TaxID=61149 RepID=A0A2P2LVU1_RHIMU
MWHVSQFLLLKHTPTCITFPFSMANLYYQHSLLSSKLLEQSRQIIVPHSSLKTPRKSSSHLSIDFLT